MSPHTFARRPRSSSPSKPLPDIAPRSVLSSEPCESSFRAREYIEPREERKRLHVRPTMRTPPPRPLSFQAAQLQPLHLHVPPDRRSAHARRGIEWVGWKGGCTIAVCPLARFEAVPVCAAGAVVVSRLAISFSSCKLWESWMGEEREEGTGDVRVGLGLARLRFFEGGAEAAE